MFRAQAPCRGALGLPEDLLPQLMLAFYTLVVGEAIQRYRRSVPRAALPCFWASTSQTRSPRPWKSSGRDLTMSTRSCALRRSDLGLLSDWHDGVDQREAIRGNRCSKRWCTRRPGPHPPSEPGDGAARRGAFDQPGIGFNGHSRPRVPSSRGCLLGAAPGETLRS